MDRDAAWASADPPAAGWLARNRGWSAPVLIGMLALVLNLAGNARTGLWDRDEPRYVVAVREMRARGDWIVPTFNGEPRYHKPILVYWLMGLSTAIGGDSPFGARLVSAVAGSLSCVLIYALGKRMLGWHGGLLAALMLAVSPIMVAESKLATTDATLTLWLVGCQYCLRELAVRPRGGLAAAFWICLSLACLTKGPIGPALLAASAALGWWFGWPAPEVWKRLSPRWGILGLLGATLPWYLTVALISRGQYLRFAIGTQIVQRLTSGMEEHGAFPGYYAALSTLAFYPWSVLVPAAAWGAWNRRKTSPDLGFLLGWMIGPWLLLECLPTRLIHYYLPAYPACALLVAWMVKTLASEELGLRRWPLGRLCLGLLGGIGIAAAVGLAAAAVTAPGHLRPPLAVLAMVLGAGTLAAMLSLQRGFTTRAVHGLIVAWSIFLMVAGGWLIPSAEPYRMSRRVGEQLAACVERTGIEPVLLNYQEPGLIHAMGRPVATVRDREGFYELLDRKGALVSVITPEETTEIADKYALEVSVVESLEGFSLTKGRSDTLQIAILKRDRKAAARGASAARTASIQQPLVK